MAFLSLHRFAPTRVCLVYFIQAPLTGFKEQWTSLSVVAPDENIGIDTQPKLL
jgi:hypothetical protein